MNPHLIQSHQHLNEGFDAIVSAHQFLEKERPLSEVLSLIDRGLVNLNDAKAELVKFRETIYLRQQSEVKEEVDELA